MQFTDQELDSGVNLRNWFGGTNDRANVFLCVPGLCCGDAEGSDTSFFLSLIEKLSAAGEGVFYTMTPLPYFRAMQHGMSDARVHELVWQYHITIEKVFKIVRKAHPSSQIIVIGHSFGARKLIESADSLKMDDNHRLIACNPCLEVHPALNIAGKTVADAMVEIRKRSGNFVQRLAADLLIGPLSQLGIVGIDRHDSYLEYIKKADLGMSTAIVQYLLENPSERIAGADQVLIGNRDRIISNDAVISAWVNMAENERPELIVVRGGAHVMPRNENLLDIIVSLIRKDIPRAYAVSAEPRRLL